MRFSIKQLLLMFVLISLIGGALSTAIRQPPRNEYQHLDISPDGRTLALVGSQGLDLFDLESQSRIDKVRWPGSMIFTPLGIRRTGRGLRFLDDDQVIYIKFEFPFGFGENLMAYSIQDRQSNPLKVNLRSGNTVAMGTPGVFNPSTIVNPTVVFDDQLTATDPTTKLTSIWDLEGNNELQITYKHQVPIAEFPLVDLSSVGKYTVISNQFTVGLDGPLPEIFDQKSGMKLADFPQFRFLRFSPDDSKFILVGDDSVAFYSIQEEVNPDGVSTDGPATNGESNGSAETATTPTVRLKMEWEIDDHFLYDFHTQAPVFSPDGSTIALSRGKSNSAIELIDANDGKILHKFSQHNSACFGITSDGTKLIIAPENSDSPIEVWDLQTKQLVNSFGRNRRILKAIGYCFAFIGWTLIWGFFSKNEQEFSSSSSRLNALSSLNPDGSGPFGIVTATEAESDSNSIIDAEIGTQTVPTPLKFVWAILAIGGVFAICWSILPMFFFQNGLMGNMFPVVVILRFVFASFGIATGVIAATRGIGRNTRFLKTAAVLQILNAFNLDIVNFVLGVVVIVLLNQNSVREYLRNKVQSQPVPDQSIRDAYQAG